ncbi:Uncharacterised protein [Paenibacillus thiaminolyticus]|nr:Uncharacterised protein [Paenibacillus thiaminolyticus]
MNSKLQTGGGFCVFQGADPFSYYSTGILLYKIEQLGS